MINDLLVSFFTFGFTQVGGRAILLVIRMSKVVWLDLSRPSLTLHTYLPNRQDSLASFRCQSHAAMPASCLPVLMFTLLMGSTRVLFHETSI